MSLSEYLYSIKHHQEARWKIFYTDEIWCDANHSKKIDWVEKITPEGRECFDQYRETIQKVNGFREGIKRSSGAGQRGIILNIDNEDGFLNGCMKYFIGKKESTSADDMNKQHFEEWFRFVLAGIPHK